VRRPVRARLARARAAAATVAVAACVLLPSVLALAQSAGDAPEISRSVGEEGGVVVFWPRVVSERAGDQSLRRAEALDDDTRALALAVQEHLRALAEEALPGRTIDLRPEPERVCPLAGCQPMTVGVVLARRNAGCAAVALIAPPGASPARLLPWAAGVRLARDEVPFREPPESEVTVTDFARCDSLLETLRRRDGEIVAAIRATAALVATEESE
jgi:hypothetical protein